jgi:hypothetical protein
MGTANSSDDDFNDSEISQKNGIRKLTDMNKSTAYCTARLILSPTRIMISPHPSFPYFLIRPVGKEAARLELIERARMRRHTIVPYFT